MTTKQSLEREIAIVNRALGLSSRPRSECHVYLWLPDDDQRHKMTDEEIIKEARAQPNPFDPLIILFPLDRAPKDVAITRVAAEDAKHE